MATTLAASAAELDASSTRFDRAGLCFAILICALTRLAVISAAYAGAWNGVRIEQRVMPPLELGTNDFRRMVADPESPFGNSFRTHLLGLAPLLNWDGQHYRSVIENGYRYEPFPVKRWPDPKAQFNIAFFPLYPLMCAGLGRLLGVPLAMVALSNLAAAAAAGVFFIWLRAFCDRPAALFAVALLCFGPAACFLSFGYPESLGLLLLVITMLAAQRHAWTCAGIACALATATRPTLMPLAPVLAIVSLTAGGVDWRRKGLRSAILLTVGLSGAAAYFGYLWIRFGSLSVYQQNFAAGWIGAGDENNWRYLVTGHEIINGLRPLMTIWGDFPVRLALVANPQTWNMSLSLATVLICLMGWRSTPPSQRPWLLLAPLIFLQRYLAAGWSTFAMESMARYMAIAVPCYAVLGGWAAREGREVSRTILIVSLFALQMVFAFNFGMNEWAG